MWHCFDSTIMSSDVALTRRSWRIRAGLIYPWHITFKPARASRLSFLCVELDISNILVGRFIGCCAWLNGALDSFPLAQRAEVLWILWSDLRSSSHRLLIHDGLRRDLQTDARVFSREKDRRKWDRWGEKLWGELVRSRWASLWRWRTSRELKVTLCPNILVFLSMRDAWYEYVFPVCDYFKLTIVFIRFLRQMKPSQAIM